MERRQPRLDPVEHRDRAHDGDPEEFDEGQPSLDPRGLDRPAGTEPDPGDPEPRDRDVPIAGPSLDPRDPDIGTVDPDAGAIGTEYRDGTLHQGGAGSPDDDGGATATASAAADAPGQEPERRDPVLEHAAYEHQETRRELDREPDLGETDRDAVALEWAEPADPADPATVGTGTDDADRGLIGRDQAADLRRRWEEVQAEFLDSPKRAVEGAHRLVAEVVDLVTTRYQERRSGLEERWSGKDLDTEDLRVTLQGYRDLFGRLLSS